MKMEVKRVMGLFDFVAFSCGFRSVRACELFTRHTFLGYLERQTKTQSRVDTVRAAFGPRSGSNTPAIRLPGS